MAKSFRMDTFEKIKGFLEKQDNYIYKSKIAKELNINSSTLNLVLSKLEVKLDEKGRVKL